MPLPFVILIALGGTCAGVLIGWLAGQSRLKPRLAQSTTDAAVLNERLTALQRERTEIVARATQLDQALRTLTEERARLETSLTERTRSSQEAAQQLREAFQSASVDALRGNSQTFLTMATETFQRLSEGAKSDLTQRQQAIETLVTPLTTSLTQVDQHLRELEQLGTKSQATLTQQISALGQETQRLASALQGTNSRGRWGEIHLRRVVELAGLVEHCDFDTQVSLSEGALRPDLIVRLPGERTLVVDAKVPLTAFIEISTAGSPEERSQRVAAHAKALKDHVRALGSKSYWKQLERSPEFVVLFLPGEGFFSTALEAEPELVDFAAQAGVVIATPTTLIALLRAIAFGWNEEQVAANAREIMKLGRDLYDRIRTFTTHFVSLRSAISGSVDAYNKALGSLETRVLVTTRKLQELGAGTGEPLAEVVRIDAEPRAVVIADSETSGAVKAG